MTVAYVALVPSSELGVKAAVDLHSHSFLEHPDAWSRMNHSNVAMPQQSLNFMCLLISRGVRSLVDTSQNTSL